jgi:hypothetical protein
VEVSPRPRTTTRRPVAKTAAKSRPKPRALAKSRARSRAGIVWIVVGGVLLAGIVFVNLAVLRLNLRLDGVTQLSSKLKAQNAALQSQLSSALASGKIQALAHSRDGLVEAPSVTYIDLGKP